jgi:hypothetical protein
MDATKQYMIKKQSCYKSKLWLNSRKSEWWSKAEFVELKKTIVEWVLNKIITITVEPV